MVHTTVSFAWADTFRVGLRRLSIGMAGFWNAARALVAIRRL